MDWVDNSAMNGAKGRYLFVINEVGFVYSHFWTLATAIQQAGWDVVIASAAVSDPERALQAGMKFYRIRPTFGIGNPISEIKSFLELRIVIRAVRPTVIHSVSLKNVLLGGLLARTTKSPAVLSAITGLGTMFAEDRLRYRLLRPIVLQGLRFAHRSMNSVIAFENRDDRQFFIDKNVVQPDRTFLIPGAGLAPDAITPTSRPHEHPIILCVTRMIRSKGIFELIEAARLLRAQGLSFQIRVVGDVDPRNPTSLVPEELHRIQSEGVVDWLGRRSDVPSLLGEADIFCLPSYREGMPRSLIEASAAGLPIVTTDVPGCREAVVDGVNGFLCPPRDASALAAKLERLILSADLRRAMGQASREWFETHFTTGHMLQAFNRCYSALEIPLALNPKVG